MKILITGGHGFIGTHLVDFLRANTSHEIWISDKCQDLTDEELTGTNAIFHLGAIPRVGVSLERPGEVVKNNTDATLRLLEYCRSHMHDIYLIHASSSSVKFADLHTNPYALGKKMSEELVTMYRTTYWIKAANVRLFNVYGPDEADYGPHTTLLKVYKDAALAKSPLYINGDGTIRRDFTHVDDVVRGLVNVLAEMMADKSKFLYELGAGHPPSINQIAWAFTRDTNLKIVYRDRRQNDAQYTSADTTLRPYRWKPMIDVLGHIKEWKAHNL